MEVKQIAPEFTRSLRHRVLWPHFQNEVDCVIDIDNREDAIHLATFNGDKIISIGSLFKMSSPKLQFTEQFRLRAMATDPAYRGMNAGRFLLEKAIEELRQRHTEVLWCDARLNAIGFYSSLGFSKLDDIYEVPLIGPHQFMWLELKT